MQLEAVRPRALTLPRLALNSRAVATIAGQLQSAHAFIAQMMKRRQELEDKKPTYAPRPVPGSLVREIEKMPAESKVIIIQDPPLPTAFKIPDCLSVHLDNYRLCAYAKRTGFGSAMGTREKNAAKATGVGLIDLTNAVCPDSGNYCPVVINNMIVWRDQHHLTATFAASLVPAIDDQLTTILNAWAGTPAAPTPSPGG